MYLGRPSLTLHLALSGLKCGCGDVNDDVDDDDDDDDDDDLRVNRLR